MTAVLSPVEVTMSSQEDNQLSREEALELSNAIRTEPDNMMQLIVRAYHGEADKALGYTTWKAYTQSWVRIRLPLDLPERRALVRELTEGRLTARAISAILGVSHMTIIRDLGAAYVGGRSPRGGGLPPSDLQPLPVTATKKERWSFAEELVERGVSFNMAAAASGLDDRQLRKDAGIRETRARVDPQFNLEGWSIRHYDKSIACDIEPAPRLIQDVELSIARLLGEVYTLNRKDQEELRRVLELGIKRLEGYEK